MVPESPTANTLSPFLVAKTEARLSFVGEVSVVHFPPSKDIILPDKPTAHRCFPFTSPEMEYK
jgi:hypothetical protein